MLYSHSVKMQTSSLLERNHNPLYAKQKETLTTHVGFDREGFLTFWGRYQQDWEILQMYNNGKKRWMQCQQFNTCIERTSTNSSFHKHSHSNKQSSFWQGTARLAYKKHM